MTGSMIATMLNITGESRRVEIMKCRSRRNCFALLRQHYHAETVCAGTKIYLNFLNRLILLDKSGGAVVESCAAVICSDSLSSADLYVITVSSVPPADTFNGHRRSEDTSRQPRPPMLNRIINDFHCDTCTMQFCQLAMRAVTDAVGRRHHVVDLNRHQRRFRGSSGYDQWKLTKSDAIRLHGEHSAWRLIRRSALGCHHIEAVPCHHVFFNLRIIE